jgi:uncharacterized RDD family membrane protein YckC
MPARGHTQEPAPLGRRVLTALIDIGLSTAGAGAVIGGAIGASAVLAKEPATASERFEQLAERVRPLGETPWPQLLKAASGLAALGMRNTRSPGMRVMHIRPADARTGGPVTLRSAIIRQLVGFAWGRLAARVTRPAFERFQGRSTALAAELEEFRRQHPDDPKADAAFFSSKRNPGTSCCAWIMVPIAVQHLTALVTPRRQTISDWVAGIAVIRD